MNEPEARKALDDILDRLGLKSGDRIMLGIDMGRIPLPKYAAELNREAFREREHRWCRFVLNALEARLGSKGTLLVPSFTYSCGKPGSRFVLETTPSENGPFTEFIRIQPHAIRSVHPIFSVSGIGQDANVILQHTGRSAFGSMSPFSRFAEHGIRFLCLGVELRNSITYIHHLEQSYGCPHRFNKTFSTEVYAENSRVPGEWYAYVNYRGFDYASDISDLQQALRDSSDLAEADWNGYPNHLAEVSAVDNLGYALLKKDSSAFVNRKLVFRFDESVTSADKNTTVATLVITATESNSAV
ncbi:MAG: AAC(3) family N-acetyltransferase [Nitrospirota bacterium]|nr:AAC(3) family N-acetyltransferase [Nitrospirota bacterium]